MADEGIVVVAATTEARPTLAADKEVDLLIKSIEEASKHTKDTLLVLLAAAFYILVAVFSTRSTDNVPLPLLAVSVSNNVFLALSPLLVIIPYLYLQLCVSDLRVRLRAFLTMNLDVKVLPSSGLLLFPFLVTKGLLGHEESLAFGSARPRDPRLGYVWSVTVLLVWVIAPAILLTLWLRFINKQQIQSLIPGIALIATMYGSSFGRPPSRFRTLLSGVTSVILILVSLASVSRFRSTIVLARVWSLAQRVTGLVTHGGNSAEDKTLSVLLVPVLAPLGVVYVVGQVFFTEKTTKWSKGILSRARLDRVSFGTLSVEADPWRFLLFAVAGLSFGVVFVYYFVKH